MQGRAFGLPLAASFPLPGLRPGSEPAGSLVRLELCSAAEADAEWESALPAGEVWRTVFPEGETVTVARRADGVHRLAFGSLAAYLVSADAGRVLCAPSDLEDPRWRRFLLDTVLWWTSALHGFFLLHACALRSEGGTVAFASGTGGGKTTLALELVRRGWSLVADDVLALEPSPDGVRVHAAPGVVNAPAATPDLRELGTPLATIGDEVWLEVEQADGAPQLLDAVVLYERGRGLARALERREATVLDLVPHCWDAAADATRARERFELLARLAEEVPVFALSAPPAMPPEEIAALVESVFTLEATAR
jgi:hypothetical protein